MFRTLKSYYYYTKSILTNSLPFAAPPSEDVVEKVNMVLDTLARKIQRNQPIDEKTLHGVIELLEECCHDDVLQVTDDEGYNVLQLAVVANSIHLVDYLISKDWDVNRGKCSLPLHLACSLGLLDIVKLLLSHGACTELEMGMCYPKLHKTDTWSGSKFFFIHNGPDDCYNRAKLPVMYAIEKDHIEVVKLLCLNQDDYVHHDEGSLLRYACQHGALKCIKYFTRKRPSMLNQHDETGATPIALAVPWGVDCTKFLLEAGSDANTITAKSENLLHLLYKKVQRPCELLDTSQLLIGQNLDAQISDADCDGNTALHILVKHVNKSLRNITDIDDGQYQTTQNQYQKQVLQCIDLLLQHHSNPTLKNLQGYSPVDELLQVFDQVFNTTTAFQGLHLSLELDFDVMYSALGYFIKYSESKDFVSPALVRMLHSTAEIELTKMPDYTEGYIKCAKLLCESGANPNTILPGISPVISQLADLARRCVSMRAEDLAMNTKPKVASFIKELLALLLMYQLNPNHKTNRRSGPGLQTDSFNGLTEFIRLVPFISEPSDLMLIHDWVLTLLQWGANPDLEPYPSDPIICHSQSSIFLKHNNTQAVNQYMHEIRDFDIFFQGGYAVDLLLLFYNSMDHAALYQCLNTAKFKARFNSDRLPSQQFTEILHELSSTPRSLKDMARVTIYKSLDRKLFTKVPKLPLPPRLKAYLLNLE